MQDGKTLKAAVDEILRTSPQVLREAVAGFTEEARQRLCEMTASLAMLAGLPELKRRGDVLHLDLAYPRIEGKPKAVEVELLDVRAAGNVRISYDFERDGWVIQQAATWQTLLSETAEVVMTEQRESWHEVAFVHAWGLDMAHMLGAGDERESDALCEGIPPEVIVKVAAWVASIQQERNEETAKVATLTARVAELEREAIDASRICDKPGCLSAVIRRDDGRRVCASGHASRWVDVASLVTIRDAALEDAARVAEEADAKTPGMRVGLHIVARRIRAQSSNPGATAQHEWSEPEPLSGVRVCRRSGCDAQSNHECAKAACCGTPLSKSAAPGEFAPIRLPTTVEPTDEPGVFVVSVKQEVRFRDGVTLDVRPDGTVVLPPEEKWPTFFERVEETQTGTVGHRLGVALLLKPTPTRRLEIGMKSAAPVVVATAPAVGPARPTVLRVSGTAGVALPVPVLSVPVTRPPCDCNLPGCPGTCQG